MEMRNSKTNGRLHLCFWLAIAAILMASACKKAENSVPADSVGGNGEPFCDSVCLYRPGDYGSANWRIPAIICLDDGTLLAINDKRKYNETDLPEDIDIVCRRSTDKGATWSEPQTIVQGTGYKHGYGDPAVVQCQNGDVVCVFVGGNGLWASTEADPQHSYVCRSTDRGLTWSQPEDITARLWGSQSINTATRNYKSSFFGSGNGLRLKRGHHAGRIMFAAAMCRKNENKLDNFVVYSDDNGQTWNVSAKAFTGGDEAKLMELADGSLLISVRRSGARGHNRSTDGGETWGQQGLWHEMTVNACNGDMLRLDDTTILHSVPNSMQRENVSIFTSNDEGQTWKSPVLMCAGPSVYSSMTLLSDGTIGFYAEKNPSGACELWYYRFNRSWLVGRQ